MVIGIALIGWDKKIGAVIDFKFPNTLNLSDDIINKIYMAHAFKLENISNEELIEISIDDQIFISYCDKKRVPSFGYEMLILILHQNENVKITSYKSKLISLAESTFLKNKQDRINFLTENIESFFKKENKKKILLLGRPGTGKSSIKKIVFEGESPKNLIYHPLDPTRGITPSIYSWLDLKLGVFDTSGQELDNLLKDTNERALAFEDSDIILYLVDFPIWVIHSDEILKHIQDIKKIIDENKYNSQLVIYFHKIDLIDKSTREQDLQKISDTINKKVKTKVYFTSIYTELIYTTYNAFYEILSSFSEVTRELKTKIDTIIKDLSKSLFFITNTNHSIVIQSMTKDFNVALINHVQKLTGQLSLTFEEMCLNDNIEHLMLSSTKKLTIVMKFLNLTKKNLLNLICVSEAYALEYLIVYASQIKLAVSNYYNKLK